MSPRLGEVVLASQSDERLVKLARSGHERAFAVIVERYRPELTALARRLSPDGKAEDIVQQAFLSAFAALRSGADVKHLRGWLYRIVRNAAARTQAPLCMPLDGATASGESVEDVVQQRDAAMSALAELARLPHRQRQAIVGTALDGRGRAEVATAMGVSEGAVRQLVHRARARIRTAVTAVTPWPMVRWLAAAHPDGGRAVGVATGASAASSGGVALKMGMVLASGAIATGMAVVDIHRDARRPDRAGPRAAAHDVDLHATRGHGQVLEVALLARAPVRSDSSRDSHAGAAEFVVARVRVRRGGDGVAARPERRRESRGAGSLRSSGRGNGAGSRWSAGAGPGRNDGGGGGGSGDGGGWRYGGDGRGPDRQSSSAPTAQIANDGGFTHGGGPGGYDGSRGGGPGSGSGFGSGPGSGDGSSGPVTGPGSGPGTGSGSGPGTGSGAGSGPGPGAGPDGASPTQANTGPSWAGGGSGH